MFLDFLIKLKESKLPVSLNEFLTFLDSLKLDIIEYDIDKFYYLARASLIKDEKLIDRLILYLESILKQLKRLN